MKRRVYCLGILISALVLAQIPYLTAFPSSHLLSVSYTDSSCLPTITIQSLSFYPQPKYPFRPKIATQRTTMRINYAQTMAIADDSPSASRKPTDTIYYITTSTSHLNNFSVFFSFRILNSMTLPSARSSPPSGPVDLSTSTSSS
jgi:hypothetical protein